MASSSPILSQFPDSLHAQINSLLGATFEKLGLPRDRAIATISQKPELGDFQCNAAMPLAKQEKKNPRDLAQAIIDAIPETGLLKECTIAGPGFINLRVSDEFLGELTEKKAENPAFGVENKISPMRLVLDYGGPNVAKAMHVGHVRSSNIGDSLRRIYTFLGHEVISDVHLGDWGTQMGMLIEEVKKHYPELPYFDESFGGEYPKESPVSIEDLQRLYPEASARCKEDPVAQKAAQAATAQLQAGRRGYRALWKHFVEVSIEEEKKDFEALSVEFTHWFGESDYHDRIAPMVNQLKQNGVAIEDDGAIIIPVAEEGDKKEIPPMLLVKSDGGFLYGTTDLATIQQRVEDFNPEAIYYVVDKRQGDHFEQVFRSARKSSIAGETYLEHVKFGTMNGPDGKPFKTRAGGVMKLGDLIQLMIDEAHRRMDEGNVASSFSDEERDLVARQVGIASLKYADLANPRQNDYIFDPVKFTAFEGKTGAYLCYSAVRIKSILRNAKENSIKTGKTLPPSNQQERDLMMTLNLFPDALESSAENRMPHHVAIYAYDLAVAFNQFYGKCHILKETDSERQQSWLRLCEVTLCVMNQALNLLGISAPERM